ncbi:uncharacterized protein ACR2FA_010671 [Aphomia sociella]
MGPQAAQALQQQMVLCPVRVVYETQMLVQPGEQMQPNQTIYINSQNPPPWIQNRLVQQQVIYVQHVPNNIVPSVAQQMDQNQMYHQHYQQQVLQPMMPQAQDVRPYQVQNVTYSAPIVQNTGANISNQPNGQIYHMNYAPFHTNVRQSTPPTVPITTNTINTKQNFTNTQEVLTNQNFMNSQRNLVPMNVMEKTNLQMNTVRQPQTMAVTPIQQTYTNTQTHSQIDPRNYFNNSKQPLNIVTNTRKMTKMHSSPPNNANNVIDGPFIYKRIYPRPQNVDNTPNEIQTIVNMPNVGQTAYNVNINSKTQSNQAPQDVETNRFYKKRKSESPDEINRSLTNMSVAETKSVEIKRKCNDLNVNNNVGQDYKMLNPGAILKEHQEKIEDVKMKNEINNAVDNQKYIDKHTEPKKEEAIRNCKDTSVRHTVYTQARRKDGALIKDIIDRKEMKERADYYEGLHKSLKDMTDKNKPLTHDVFKTDKEYILTHVLDGIVIQESNYAFPIQTPDVKKIQTNPKVLDIGKEEIRIGCEKNGELTLTALKGEEKIKETRKDKPFADLKQATVKSWTVNQLFSYLAKYKWDDTISALREQEIDGESLFLVNKTQLLTIGVQKEHADIICDYINS